MKQIYVLSFSFYPLSFYSFGHESMTIYIFAKHMINIQNIQGIHTTEKITQLKNEQRT